jgi:hypothetical protein
MFWKKKTAFQEIEDRWDGIVDIASSEESYTKAKALQDVIQTIAMSASVIDPKKSLKLAESGAKLLNTMLRGAILIGYDYSKRYKKGTKDFTRAEDSAKKMFPDEAIEPMVEIIRPLRKVVNQLIEISHAPGRPIFPPENKEAVIDSMEEAILKVATAYFLEGVICADTR